MSDHSMEYLQPYVFSFQKYLAGQSLGQSPETLYHPADYILSIGGKRIRPILVLLAAHLYNEEYEKALDAAFSVEVFHNFTLVHDDIMDNAAIRRGQPTVHLTYSVNQAILTGDVMLIKAYQRLLSYKSDDLSAKLLEVFLNMSVLLCEGQQRDMDFEKKDVVQISDYITMIEGKTAVLLGAALQMGALIGGATEEDALHLYKFGLNFGIAFQLQDDVLDVFGSGENVGKVIGGDIIQNKKTYLYLKALELASDAQKEKLLFYYNEENQCNPAEKVTIVTKIFEELVVREYASQVMEAYRDLAISHVHSCQIEEDKKELLIRLVHDFLYRES
jgi:geranylgeranyl diphosphate synthase type II